MLHPPWSFDIDRYLNRFIPSPPWRYIPYPIAWFFGHRKHQTHNIGTLAPIFWAFIGIWCSLSIIQVVDIHIPDFEGRGVPLIIGSFGAAAVLEFYSIESPLAQPRNAIFGQIISALVGVAICKLFKLSDSFEEYRWAGGALACALATSMMALTKTVHPPAGATALLAVIDDSVVHLGWFLVPVMMLGCGLMLAVALLVNNIERRFPVYWWTPESLKRERPVTEEPKKSIEDSEAGNQDAQAGSEPVQDMSALERQTTLHGDTSPMRTDEMEIVIRRGDVIIPDGMQIRQEEMQWLMGLADRL
ncbi:HPP family protein [Sarocladium implicatum]|nr:HPP family protein [Sarocladium implicatum]